MTAAIRARFSVARPGFALEADLALPGRGVTVLYGPSGAGKTTLMRAIAGLERHPGRLEVDGAVWQDDAAGVFLPVHRRPIGYVFQEASLLPHLTVQDNLDFGWKRIAPADRQDVDRGQVLDMLGIGHLLGRRPASLSGGERQRVAIARALLTHPRLLLMDEPLAAVDASRKQEVLPHLERLRDELSIPIVYISHSPDEVARLADHMVLLDAGRVLASGPIAEVTARLDLPLALDDNAGVVLDGTAVSCDAGYGLADVRVGDCVVRLTHGPVAAGAALRLRILARDVSLSLSAHAESSILNQLPATVVADQPAASPAHVIVRLDAGGMPLLARITRQSRDRLGIAPGRGVWVQFKAAGILAR